MLLPYRDNNPVKRRAYVTWSLIVINVSLFLTYGLPSFEGLQPEFADMDDAWRNWSLYAEPSLFFSSWSGLFTHMFLHGGWLHLLGNMLMLYIFGNNLEDVLGHFWFLLFYVACGLAGGLVFIATETNPMVRAGGASGAIAGIMGGYLLLFPRVKIMSLLLLPNIIWPFSILVRMFWKLKIWGYWPILFFTFGVPAWVYLGVWAGINVLGAYSEPATSQIGYSIHLGGFFAGMALIMIAPVSRRRAKISESARTDGQPQTRAGAPVSGPWDRPSRPPGHAGADTASKSSAIDDPQSGSRPNPESGKIDEPENSTNEPAVKWQR